jgi:hypothetical protein
LDNYLVACNVTISRIYAVPQLITLPRTPLTTRSTPNTGGSVAKLLLQHPDEYAVRALTRNPDSEAARKLSALGAQVVQGDLADISTLGPAFHGCWGAFVVTNFYDSVSEWSGFDLVLVPA